MKKNQISMSGRPIKLAVFLALLTVLLSSILAHLLGERIHTSHERLYGQLHLLDIKLLQAKNHIESNKPANKHVFQAKQYRNSIDSIVRSDYKSIFLRNDYVHILAHLDSLSVLLRQLEDMTATNKLPVESGRALFSEIERHGLLLQKHVDQLSADKRNLFRLLQVALIVLDVLLLFVLLRIVWYYSRHHERAISELQQKEKRFRTFYEHSPLSYLLLDEHAHIKETNQVLEQILGYSKAEIIDRRLTDFLTTESRQTFEYYWQDQLSSGELNNIELDLLDSSGQKRSFALDGKVGYDNPLKGQIHALLKDISYQKQQTDLIRQRLDALTSPVDDDRPLSFTDLFDIDEIQAIQDAFAKATNVASIITDVHGNPITRPSRFTFLCQHLIRKTERGLHNCKYSDAVIGRQNPDGPIMQPCLSVGLWDGGASITAGNRHLANWLIGQVRDENTNINKAIKYADHIGVDKDLFHKELLKVPQMPKKQFEHVCQALFLIAKQLSKLALNNIQKTRYIHTLEQAEDTIRESESRLKKAQQIAHVGHWELSLDGEHFSCSEELYRIFELDKTATGAELFMLLRAKIDKDYHEQFENLLQSAYETGKIPPNEFKINLGEGHQKYLRVEGEMHIKKNRQEVFVGIIQDISDQKSIEFDLERAKLKAEESDRLKSAFLANMSHEVRTPMNAIVGFSNLLLLPEIDDQKRHEFVQLINMNSESLLQLIDTVVELARIETQQVKLVIESCKLNKLLTELYDYTMQQKEKIGKPGLTIRFMPGVDDPDFAISADASRLRQILINLLENALKFTDEGFIEFAYEVKNNHTLEFYVKDSGIGIPEDQQGLIFDRFHKTGEHAAKLYRGTGLGLTIALKLVELQGGKIWLESTVNKGSCFYFSLPYEPSDTIKPDTMKKTPVLYQYDWHDKVILIAEDEETNFMFLNEVLTRTDAKILHAYNGEEAVKYCQDKDVDLVLMDIKMPVMNGYEATRRIKKLRNDLPVIAQTAYAMADDRELILKAGCDDYISKPIKRQILFAVISKYL